MPAASDAAPFEPAAEQMRLATAAMRHAAELLGDLREAPWGPRQRVQHYCDALVAATAHLRLAWAWFGAPDADVIEPQVIAGTASAYAKTLSIRRSWLTSLGPALRTLQGHAPRPFNVNSASLYAPWREVADEHGVRSVLSVPLAVPGDPRRGLFVLYADVPDYFDAVGVHLFEAAGELIASVLSHAEQHRLLERRARTDALTGLANRAHAQATMRALLGEPALAPVSLLLLDLDHFKHINDEFGHAAGDAVLRVCAACLREALRRDDGIARWGGEEFVVWLPETQQADAAGIAEKLRAALAQSVHEPLVSAGGVTASIGVVQVDAGESLASALDRADGALYAAKHAGRNRVCVAPSGGVAPRARAGEGGGDGGLLVAPD